MKINLNILSEFLKISAAQLYVALFGRNLIKQDIWLFSEKRTEARDNGYHFYKYIRTNHPEINACYAIEPGSADREKVAVLGKVIDYNSFEHCKIYCAAKVRAASQIHGAQPFENTPGMRHIKLFMRKDQIHVNLKHGITKDYFDSSFNYKKAGFDIYISGAKPEYEAVKAAYNYPDRNIALTGFCRFDALHNLEKPEKILLLMPTFREWLRTSDSAKAEASPMEMARFKESEYFKHYYSLLHNQQLLRKLKEKGYKLYFYPHYTLQPYIEAFSSDDDCVMICNRKNYDVQDLLKRSAMLLTDYSSVFFDFGYMKKPMAFFQFDLEEYRQKHYKEGYFSYMRDAFGPVLTDFDEMLAYITNRLDNDMVMEEKYKERAERFFIPWDTHNCERVYEAIQKYGNTRGE